MEQYKKQLLINNKKFNMKKCIINNNKSKKNLVINKLNSKSLSENQEILQEKK